MSYSAFIARRYLHSRRNAGFFSFITGIATLGVMLGTATLIIALSVLGGFEREITEKVIGFTSDVQVLGFQNLPLPNFERNAKQILELPLTELGVRDDNPNCQLIDDYAYWFINCR